MWILKLLRRRKRIDITAPRVRVVIAFGSSSIEPTNTLPPKRLFRSSLFC